MNKLYFSLLFYLLSSTFIIAQPKEGMILWEQQRPITWSDFKAKPVRSSPYHAQTQGSLNYTFDNKGPGQYIFKLNVKFVKQKSWSKPKEQTDNLLKHEQGHFDIYELYGRIIMKRLKDAKVFNEKNFSDKVAKIFRKGFEDLQKFQEKYDRETNHSKDKKKQEEWNEKIADLLEELAAYKVKEVAFKV
ncbi:MAG: DUF922 domain-containing protein [Flavobacteriales bacterium]|nr:DUF922 domain-containing protein [Flavobacteriales bacterium]